MTAETDTRHAHEFPCNPPGGTLRNPGPCACGKTWPQSQADRLLAEAIRALESAYGAPPRMAVQWAVHWGSDDLNDGAGFVELYDGEQDVREHLVHYKGGRVVGRTVISLPWQPVREPADPAAPGTT